ncbi:MAG: alkaline phosphatase family protein [Solirubrobacteraceae bacterium]
MTAPARRPTPTRARAARWPPTSSPTPSNRGASPRPGTPWFCSAPCQTYPNRRFLMAGTAYGDIATDTSTLQNPPPPSGTIFDRLHAYGISWTNYFTDLPQTGIIPSIIESYPTNLAPIAQFLADCAAGSLPSVSFVDPEFGVLSDIGSPLASFPQVATNPIVAEILQNASGLGGDQESPQDMYYGEAWATPPAGTTSTARASPASSPRLTPSRTRSPMCSTTTPRCRRRLRRSGTCRR